VASFAAPKPPLRAIAADDPSNTMTYLPVESRTVVKRFLYRPLWLSATLMGTLLALALGLLMFTSWRELRRLEPVHAHLAELGRLVEAAVLAQDILLDSLNGGSVEPARLDGLRSAVDRIISLDSHLAPGTPARLQRMDALLGDAKLHPGRALQEIPQLIRDTLASETRAHDQLLGQVRTDTLAEFEIATYCAIVFPLLALLMVFALRNRILLPLRTLQSFMTLLGRQDYSLAPIGGVDPSVRPLFENYNQLVTRLDELRQEQQTRERSLEQEVRAATRALLEQQRGLARAERLAATGEIAAGVAHELRNPLAGIQMALQNLQKEIVVADQAERLDLVVSEIKRLIRLLNDLLSQARQPPEPCSHVDVGHVVRELLSLVRYQVPAHIRVEQRVSEGTHCELPEAGLRQALLNLILNAAQALGETSGTIVLSAERRDDVLTISVVDDGPGFPPPLLQGGARLFATWREQGTGLGIAMVQRFSRDLGGEVQLTNLQPTGASATLRLPCRSSR
jgi:two-component system NtrC family sensor kinase